MPHPSRTLAVFVNASQGSMLPSMKRLSAIFLLAFLLPLSAHAWWDSAWTVRKKITLDTQAAGVAAELSSVPVLVRLSSGNFDFLAAKEDGSDIRFVAQDDKTVLPSHIELFDPVNELAFVWVHVPKLAGNDNGQHIWLYMGNEKAPAVPGNRAAYDATKLAVLHLSDKQGLPQDASANANHVTSGKAAYVTDGLMGGAARLAGDAEGLVLGGASLAGIKELTFSAWLKLDKLDGQVFSYGPLALNLVAGVPVVVSGPAQARAPAPLPAGSWHHVAVTAGTNLTLYVDGKPVATAASALVAAPTLKIGAGLSGDIDEVQVSGASRPAAWMALQVESQSQTGRLLKMGTDETTDTSEAASHFTTTMNNLTIDGWVVVVICAFMFVVAIWVMVSKTLLLARTERANELFAEAFGNMSRGLAQLGDSADAHRGQMDSLVDAGDKYRHSSLYRIYRVGVGELHHRFKRSDGEAGLPVLSARSMNAVRASLDAQMTREGQSLNKAMVLLTIAISGGPFLGLLGTVIGVMITFAAIAAAGDVNVNAIAPGIAAALVATVAGLGVAIPALFGYNYLLTRIKSVSADMNVFVDDFVARMAEAYGG
jgi:biopolymer transport protein ExbB